MAATIVALSHPAVQFVSGSVIFVDGGEEQRLMATYDILREKKRGHHGQRPGHRPRHGLELAHHGVNVAVNYFRHKAQAEETAAHGRSRGRRAIVVKAHVGEVEGPAVGRDRRAGVRQGRSSSATPRPGVLKPVVEQQPKGWEWTININALDPVQRAGRRTPTMTARGWGRIIGITSFGYRGGCCPSTTWWGSTKAAIEALIRYLAVELAPHGIVCNTVSPGVVETEALSFFEQG